MEASRRHFSAILWPKACFLILVLWAVSGPAGVTAMWIHPEQNGSVPVWYRSPRMRFMDPPSAQNWNAKVFEGEWVRVESSKTTLNLTGKIVLYELGSGESQEEAVRLFTGRGIVALFSLLRIETPYPGFGNWVRDHIPLKDHDFPCFELTLSQNASLKGWYTNQSRIWVTVGNDENPWEDIFKIGLPIVGIYILLFSGCILIYAVWKLTCIILLHGFQLSMAQIVLWFNVVGCLLRVVWCFVDPFGAAGISRFVFVQVFFTISYPFAINGTLLISLYWHEMVVRKRNTISLFLSKLKWPFFIWCLFTLAFEITTSTLRGYYYSFTILLFIDGAMYIIVSVSVLIFFIVTKYRLQKVFRKLNRGLNSRRQERLTLATFQIQAMLAIMCIWVVLLIIIGVTALPWYPVGYPIIWSIFFLTLQIMCLLQVILIRAPIVSPAQLYRCWRYGESFHMSFSSSSNSHAITEPKSTENSSTLSPRGAASSESTGYYEA